MIIKAKISGLSTLLSKFKIANQIGAAQERGIRQVALLLRDTMVKYAGQGHPDHPEVRTGRLRSSIRYSMSGGGTNATAKVGSDASYAAFVEFGHKNRGGGFTKPYTWFRPAINDVIDSGKAAAIVNQALMGAIGGMAL